MLVKSVQSKVGGQSRRVRCRPWDASVPAQVSTTSLDHCSKLQGVVGCVKDPHGGKKYPDENVHLPSYTARAAKNPTNNTPSTLGQTCSLNLWVQCPDGVSVRCRSEVPLGASSGVDLVT